MRILTYPSPALKQRVADIEGESRSELRSLVDELAKTMYDSHGVGLAATQIGIMKRLLIYDIDEELVVLCNPRITDLSDETVVEEEGCLSLPGIAVPIERSTAVTCEGVDLDGRPVTISAEGLLARVLQHELDHLDGVLIIDRATSEQRREAIRRYNEIMRTLG